MKGYMLYSTLLSQGFNTPITTPNVNNGFIFTIKNINIAFI